MKRLRAQLKAAHVFEHREGETWLKLILMLAALVSCYVGIVCGPVWLGLALLVPAAIATTTATLIGHEGSHGSFSERGIRNQLLAYLTLPLLGGISASYWKHKHNGLHHGHPNVIGEDPDIALWPVALSRVDYERAGPLLRWFQRTLQGELFWPASALLPTVMRVPSYLFLAEQVRTRGLTRALLLDVLGLVGHYALWIGLPAQFWGLLPAIALYACVWGIVGVLLALIFAPAHLGLPLCTAQQNGWRHQLETTRNFRAPRWLSYFYVGLDHQLEHHIFPQIPHQNLPTAAAIMRRWCGELGLPYHEVGVVEGVHSVTTFIREAWRLEPGSLPASPASAACPPAPYAGRASSLDA